MSSFRICQVLRKTAIGDCSCSKDRHRNCSMFQRSDFGGCRSVRKVSFWGTGCGSSKGQILGISMCSSSQLFGIAAVPKVRFWRYPNVQKVSFWGLPVVKNVRVWGISKYSKSLLLEIASCHKWQILGNIQVFKKSAFGDCSCSKGQILGDIQVFKKSPFEDCISEILDKCQFWGNI